MWNRTYLNKMSRRWPCFFGIYSTEFGMWFIPRRILALLKQPNVSDVSRDYKGAVEMSFLTDSHGK